MQIRHLLGATLGALVLTGTTRADDHEESMQKSQKFERTITKTVRADYLLFLPKDYQPKDTNRWPMILFLHGAGERGKDISKVAIHGPPKIVKSNPGFPFIVVSPQCPDGETWSKDVLLSLLDEVVARHVVDTNRIYLTGLSMGGYGAWSLGTSHPERFAAIAPICGGGETINVLLSSRLKTQALKSLGVWAFHGYKDPVVKVEESERMILALRKAGCRDVRFTIYPEAEHDSWTETYENEQIYEWFLKHERKPLPAGTDVR